MKNTKTIVTQGLQPVKLRRKPSSRRSPQDQKIFPIEASPHLQITSVDFDEKISPKENRYILLIQPQGIRAAGGQYTADEAYEIAKGTWGWDWKLDENNHPYCLAELEALLDAICRQAAGKGGVQ
jgi:hypothetical protein